MTLQVTRRAEDPYGRQRLIGGWNQRRLENARVLIAGIGALGNACAADLVLTGVRRVALVDFDHVDPSNLSRTILFRQGDEGRRKVDVARARLLAMALSNDARFVALDADVVWDVGWGLYRRMDLVLACLDSTEARVAVGVGAWRFSVPAIVGGIFGLDGSVVVQGIGDGACVACTLAPGEWQDRAARYSCDNVRRIVASHALVPATQVIASITGGLMVNEGLQLLQGDTTRTNVRLFFTGARPDLCRMQLPRRALCGWHLPIRAVFEEPALSAQLTAGALVEHLASSYGADVVVDLGRDFLVSAACKGCRARLPLARARHRTTERDLVCDGCWATRHEALGDPEFEILRVLSVTSPRAALDLPLHALGIPPLHVLELTTGETTRWVELTGDAEEVLPGWPPAEGRQGGPS